MLNDKTESEKIDGMAMNTVKIRIQENKHEMEKSEAKRKSTRMGSS